MRPLKHSGLRVPNPVRAAFTLVELLAVIAIIGILMVFLLPKIPEMIDAAESTACKKNLSEIHKGILLHKTKHDNRLPRGSGVRFFTVLVTEDTWENTKTSAQKLTCPGVDDGYLTGIRDLDYEERYTDEEALDGTFSAYAGRNTDEFPLKRLSGKDAIVADDNDGGGNHRTTTNVLYGDGSVSSFELSTEKNNGNVDPDETYIVVGPDAMIEDLQKFSLD